MEFRGILDLLNMFGAFLRKAYSKSKVRLNDEFRTRDNTLLGLGSLCALVILGLFLFSC